MNKLKKRWGIDSNFQILIIFFVFAITGSSAVRLAGPICEFLECIKKLPPGLYIGRQGFCLFSPFTNYYWLHLAGYSVNLVSFGNLKKNVGSYGILPFLNE